MFEVVEGNGLLQRVKLEARRAKFHPINKNGPYKRARSSYFPELSIVPLFESWLKEKLKSKIGPGVYVDPKPPTIGFPPSPCILNF